MPSTPNFVVWSRLRIVSCINEKLGWTYFRPFFAEHICNYKYNTEKLKKTVALTWLKNRKLIFKVEKYKIQVTSKCKKIQYKSSIFLLDISIYGHKSKTLFSILHQKNVTP